jgi:tetratricopeptide (TPR) repeat protein
MSDTGTRDKLPPRMSDGPPDSGELPRGGGPSSPRVLAPDEEVTVVDLVTDANNSKLASALRRCLTEPRDPSAWDELDAARMASPAEVVPVAELYRVTLDRDLPRETLLIVGARALRLHDEWALPEESLIKLLTRVLQIDPTVVWAFERLSLELTTRGRYADLLTLYDRVLAAVEGEPRHAALLEEAADVARDGAGEIDRAIGYLDRLLALDPSRQAVAASLERLLAQRGRRQDLVAHWARRMEIEGPARTIVLRCRMAHFSLETMNDPVAAAAALAPLAPEEGDDEVARMLEKILEAPSASPDVRSDALAQLRRRYDATGRAADLIRPLRALLSREGSDVGTLHAEIVRRLVAEGRDEETKDDLATILARQAEGSDDDVVDRLLHDTFEGEIVGCRPSIDRDGRRDIVRRAASLAASLPEGQGRDWAVRLYRRLLRDLPSDAGVILGLATLFQASGRRAELIELRQHELARTTDDEHRRTLRLEVAELHLALGDTALAITALHQNLDEQPTDVEVIFAVISTLEKHNELEALCDLLERHAATVSTTAPGVAIGLWAKAAGIAEKSLSDGRRTIQDHRLIVAISSEPASFDALARIHTELGEHATAVEWLERLLATDGAPASIRTTHVLRLASAHLAAGHSGESLACVEARMVADPGDMRLHVMQIELRRASADREGLVAALVAAAPYAERAIACSLLREAATVLTEELGAPVRAVALLEQLVAIRPDVQSRAVLADTLYRAGSREQARATAKETLSEFGERHPPERAAVHLLLGRIAHELGADEEARHELESAVKTDMGNAGAHLLLGRLCREAGELDRAERALHAALLLQRRGSDETLPPRSETLVELHRLAVARGDAVRAAENLAAAFDAATGDREARALERALRGARMDEPLLRALDGRLLSTQEPAARAVLLAERSAVLRSLGRCDEALEAALRGLALAPADSRLHEQARDAGVASGRVGSYAELLESLIATALEGGDGVGGCTLLLRLGEVYEGDLERLDAAEAAYARAEDTSESILDVWRRRARLAEKRGDRETQLTVLRRLADSASDLAPSERADTLYALADLELGAEDSVDAGLSSLALALGAEARPARAARSLEKALPIAVDREPIAKLYETVARAHGDDAMLLDALWVTAHLPRPPQSALQEAFDLATRLGADDRASELLERAVSLAGEGEDPADALWAIRLLTDACERHRDLRGGLSWAQRAAELCDGEESSRFSARAAAFATKLGDTEAAIGAFERLLGDDPSNPDVWSSILDLLRSTGDTARLEAALARATAESRDPERRTLLRMERARLLFEDDGRRADVKSTLKAVLDEEPDHTAALDLLAGLLDPASDHDELVALLTRRLDIALEQDDAGATELALRLADLTPRADAVDIVRSALRAEPECAALLRRLVQVLDPQTDIAERADAIERLLTDDLAPEGSELAAELLAARIAVGDADAAERALDLLSSIDPAHTEVLPALEWLARARIAEADECPEDEAWLLCAAARIQDRIGDTTAVLETLARAYAVAPDDQEVLELYARRLFHADRADLAIAIASEAILRDAEPEVRAERLAMRASLHTARGDHEAAVADLEGALRDADAWLPELVAALGRARRAAKGTSAFRELSLREAEALELAGRVEEARDLLGEVAGDDPPMLRKLLDLDVLTEQWDAATADGERLMATMEGPGLAEVALMVASAFERTERHEEVLTTLERAHDADPSNGAVLGWLRQVYVQAGAFRELSNRLLLEAQRTTDKERRFDRLIEVGQLRMERLGEAAAAIGPLSEALEIRPDDAHATSLLVDAFAAAGLIDDAVATLDAAIERQGPRRSRELSELERRMARVVSKRAPEAALHWLTLAFECNPKSPEIASELADLAIALLDYDVALRALRALTSKSCEPEVRARAYVAQADIALRQANKPRALVCARKALAETPDLEEAQAMLRQLERWPAT